MEENSIEAAGEKVLEKVCKLNIQFKQNTQIILKNIKQIL